MTEPRTWQPIETAPNDPADFARLQWTLNNIYTLARRALRRAPNDEKWGHVLRLCEQQGCKPKGVLRDNGGSVR